MPFPLSLMNTLPGAKRPKAHSNIPEAKSHASHRTDRTGLRLALPFPQPQTWAGPKGQFRQHPSWPIGPYEEDWPPPG
ncbi:hypothetical protein PAL_GLEAN10011168 [Pteropus alecto]|uniref:Uncharacterized protein n=1 Tax=Pteropus alecto TaxID=9402 RepID=L5KN87_PTEAL|nr:hypothetical protein PAL_GLEAN10011168 [Pteropus alecto]